MIAVLATWALGLGAGLLLIIAVSAALAALCWLLGTEDGQGLIAALFFVCMFAGALYAITVGALQFGRWVLAVIA